MNNYNIPEYCFNEPLYEYINKVCDLKRLGVLTCTWNSLANYLNYNLGLNYSESSYRKGCFMPDDEEDLRNKSIKLGLFEKDYQADEGGCEIISSDEGAEDILIKIEKEKMKNSDIWTQARANLRRIAREETIKEIARDAVLEIQNNYPLLRKQQPMLVNKDKEAILCLSDWHYGIEVDNYWNKYNTSIALDRIYNLKLQTIQLIEDYDISTLHIVDLGDLICGRIHLSLRLQSRVDVITQTMTVAEVLAQFINEISEYTDVHYYSCLDNHSRVEPIKSDSLELETLVRIIPWYLESRLSDTIKSGGLTIHKNEYGPDIIKFETLGHKVACVHGHNDAPGKVVDNLTTMTKEAFDLICTAHYHHFSGDEKNEVVVVGNGSLMGTDTYAKTLRLTSKPSQNFIIVEPDNVISSIHRILV